MKVYKLKFRVQNHPEIKSVMLFMLDGDDIQGKKEEWAMKLEKQYNCPVECVEVEEI